MNVVPQIRRLQCVVFCMTLALLLPAPVFPYYFTQTLKLSSGQYGFALGGGSLAHLFSAIVYGKASDRIGRRTVMLFQTALSFALYLTLASLVLMQTYKPSLRHAIVAVFVGLGCANTVNLLCCSAVCDLCLSAPLEVTLADREATPEGTTSLATQRPKYLAQVAGVLGLAGVVGPPAGQLIQQWGSTAEQPCIVLLLAAIASFSAGIFAYTLKETNQSGAFTAPSLNFWARVGQMVCQIRGWFLSSTSTMVQTNIGGVGSQRLPTSTSFDLRGRSPLLGEGSAGSRTNSSESVKKQLCTANESFLNLLAAEPPQSLESTPSRVTTSGPPSEVSVVRGDGNCNLNVLDLDSDATEVPDWKPLAVVYGCQAIKALSVSTFTACYALVLDLMLPRGWLWGLTNMQVLALGLSSSNLVRVVIQLVFFQSLLHQLRGPVTLLLGCALLSCGQIATYSTLKWLPEPLGLYSTSPTPGAAASFALIHFIAVGALFSAGYSLTEPALSSLVALCVTKHKKYQGLAQGVNSASNLLGSAIGPPLFGWVLAYKADPGSAGFTPMPIPEFDRLEGFQGEKFFPEMPPPQIIYTYPSEQVNFHPSSSLRPAVVFFMGALLAALPLLVSRRVVKISKGWQIR